MIENKKYKKYTKNEPFNVTKGIGIEIHFNKAISDLFSFFRAIMIKIWNI